MRVGFSGLGDGHHTPRTADDELDGCALLQEQRCRLEG